jgi:hypothetical protein
MYRSRSIDLGTIGGGYQLHGSAVLPPRERASGMHWIGGWMGPRTGPGDKRGTVCSLSPYRDLCRPARSQSLYRLRSRGSFLNV